MADRTEQWLVGLGLSRPTPGVNLTGSPMLAASADGRLELLVVGNDGQLWAQWQTAPSNGWSGWASHGRQPPGVNLSLPPRPMAAWNSW